MPKSHRLSSEESQNSVWSKKSRLFFYLNHRVVYRDSGDLLESQLGYYSRYSLWFSND